MNGDKKDRRVAVSIGAEVGNVSAMQVEEVILIKSKCSSGSIQTKCGQRLKPGLIIKCDRARSPKWLWEFLPLRRRRRVEVVGRIVQMPKAA
jgi:hypothetical protein